MDFSSLGLWFGHIYPISAVFCIAIVLLSISHMEDEWDKKCNRKNRYMSVQWASILVIFGLVPFVNFFVLLVSILVVIRNYSQHLKRIRDAKEMEIKADQVVKLQDQIEKHLQLNGSYNGRNRSNTSRR